MDSISKLNTALLSMPNELTMAAANFNLDFSLMKVQAPKEFHGLRDALSSCRRRDAEEGVPHITARKLGALFETMVPPIEHLTHAYGRRVSDICSGSRESLQTQRSPALGIFADQEGPDGTSIWAAATSGKGALAVHLLACMLARVWKSHEAISLWVEIVERRKQEIKDKFDNTTVAQVAELMAAKQVFTRQHLAAWDSSARAWLQTADAAKRLQQTQLMLIISNLQIPVNSRNDPYESVITAWKSALHAMNRLVQGIPQQVQDGTILLAISSWHLYPDMQVLADKVTQVNQKDELMEHALVTVSVHGLENEKKGVFWSLPLARMRYYSPPVVSERRLASDTSRVSMDEFCMVVLGIVIAQWGTSCSNKERCLRLITVFSNRLGQLLDQTPWLKLLADAANQLTASSGVQHQQLSQLLGLGMRRCNSFLNDPVSDPPHFFGLEYLSPLLRMISIEHQVEMLRRVAERQGFQEEDIIVRYQIALSFDYEEDLDLGLLLPKWERGIYGYASAKPQSRASLKRSRDNFQKATLGHCRWIIKMMDEVSCEGDGCGCMDPALPACICAAMNSRCTTSCHPDAPGCSSQSSESQYECIQGCPGNKQCRGCFHRLTQREIEQKGEQCFLIPPHAAEDLGTWDFALTTDQRERTVYNFLFGDVSTCAIFIRNGVDATDPSIFENGPRVTIDEVEEILKSDDLNLANLHGYLEDWWESWDGKYASPCEQQRRSMMAIVSACSLYKSMRGATINLEAVRLPLYVMRWTHWCKGGEFQGLEHRLACIAMFESGEFDCEPSSLKGVMALSSGDSIFVTSMLLTDPSDDTDEVPVQRVFGNLGRPEMALLISPSEPALKDYDIHSWHMIKHSPFDGQFQDNFANTSLHLKFTDFEMPVDVGERGLRDTQVILLESLVYVNDRGHHIGDLDIVSASKSSLLRVERECSHRTHISATTHQEPVLDKYKDCLLSLDCWDEFFDFPRSAAGIFRTSGNWQARLAAAAASVQVGKKTLILPKKPCLQCIGSPDKIKDIDVIIA